jgi:hypothetical protein
VSQDISVDARDVEASRRLAEAFDSSVIDALLADAQASGTPIDGADGLLNRMTKAVIERALQVEMTQASRPLLNEGAGPMTGKHRLLARRQPRAIEIVDIYTLVTHLFTPDDDAARHGVRGHLALCGADVSPASFTRPPGNGYCQACRASIPTLR